MPTPAEDPKRLKYLDGLRGLAALSVFACHAIEMLVPDPQKMNLWHPLQTLWDGESAVILFFVLSGFVLTLPYVGPAPKKIDTVPFLIRRLTRLYPAYWFAIALALVLRRYLYIPGGLDGLMPWFSSLWSSPLSPSALLKYFALIAPGFKSMDLDPSIWSLAVEVKVSLLFPLVLFLVQRTKRAPYALFVLAAILTASLFGFMGNFLAFLSGSYLAKYRTQVVAFIGSSRWLRAALLLVAILTYGAFWSMPGLPMPRHTAANVLGASLFLALFLGSRSLKAMGTWLPVWFLGEVSYSFYLTHLPILLAVTSWLYPRTGSVLLSAAVSLLLSLALSWLVYRAIEVPCQNWGRSTAKVIGTRRAGRAKVAV